MRAALAPTPAVKPTVIPRTSAILDPLRSLRRLSACAVIFARLTSTSKTPPATILATPPLSATASNPIAIDLTSIFARNCACERVSIVSVSMMISSASSTELRLRPRSTNVAFAPPPETAYPSPADREDASLTTEILRVSCAVRERLRALICVVAPVILDCTPPVIAACADETLIETLVPSPIEPARATDSTDVTIVLISSDRIATLPTPASIFVSLTLVATEWPMAFCADAPATLTATAEAPSAKDTAIAVTSERICAFMRASM